MDFCCSSFHVVLHQSHQNPVQLTPKQSILWLHISQQFKTIYVINLSDTIRQTYILFVINIYFFIAHQMQLYVIFPCNDSFIHIFVLIYI